MSEVAQLLVNGLVAGTILAVPAIGFTAIYAVLRFPNFAIAAHVTIGAFAGWLANTLGGMPASVAVVAAFVVAGLAGVLNDELILKPFRPRGGLTIAIARAKGEATGTAIKDNVRKISQGSGVKVDNAVDGLKLLAQGKEINYEGASGPCDFTETGDIIDCKIRYDVAEKGAFKLVKLL